MENLDHTPSQVQQVQDRNQDPKMNLLKMVIRTRVPVACGPYRQRRIRGGNPIQNELCQTTRDAIKEFSFIEASDILDSYYDDEVSTSTAIANPSTPKGVSSSSSSRPCTQMAPFPTLPIRVPRQDIPHTCTHHAHLRSLTHSGGDWGCKEHAHELEEHDDRNAGDDNNNDHLAMQNFRSSSPANQSRSGLARDDLELLFGPALGSITS